MSFSTNDKPIGNVPPVKSTPMLVPIPEDELKKNRKYLIEKNTTLSDGKTIRRRYKGVLDELKDENCYKFKYLENVNKNIKEKIHEMTLNGDDNDTFVRIYDAPADGDILTLDQVKNMKEINHDHDLVVGNTYYVRYLGPDEITDHTYLDSFRGTYNGRQATPWEQYGAESDHTFSNIVKLNTKICLNDKTNITFYYTAEDLIETDRQRRVLGELIQFGEAAIKPSERFGGNKRKTNKQKRKSNKRKTNRRKINKRKAIY